MKVFLTTHEWVKFKECPKEINDLYLNEEHANYLFHQSLKELNYLGGLHPKEIVAIIDKSPKNIMNNMDTLYAIERIIDLTFD